MIIVCNIHTSTRRKRLRCLFLWKNDAFSKVWLYSSFLLCYGYTTNCPIIISSKGGFIFSKYKDYVSWLCWTFLSCHSKKIKNSNKKQLIWQYYFLLLTCYKFIFIYFRFKSSFYDKEYYASIKQLESTFKI